MKVVAQFKLKGEMIQMNETETKIEAVPEVKHLRLYRLPHRYGTPPCRPNGNVCSKSTHSATANFPKSSKAITEGWDAATASEHILAANRAKQPSADVNIVIKTDAPSTRQNAGGGYMPACGHC
jgi:hypothetical protein